MDKAHYYVLVRKSDRDSGDVLGFFLTREEAEQAKSNYDPLQEMQIIETDSTLNKV